MKHTSQNSPLKDECVDTKQREITVRKPLDPFICEQIVFVSEMYVTAQFLLTVGFIPTSRQRSWTRFTRLL